MNEKNKKNILRTKNKDEGAAQMKSKKSCLLCLIFFCLNGNAMEQTKNKKIKGEKTVLLFHKKDKNALKKQKNNSVILYERRKSKQ